MKDSQAILKTFVHGQSSPISPLEYPLSLREILPFIARANLIAIPNYPRGLFYNHREMKSR